MNRRQFIRNSTLMGLGYGVLNSRSLARENIQAPARVVRASCPGQASSPDTAFLGRILDRALAALTGQPAAQAWQALFSPRDVVGLKVNCLAGRGLSTHPALVMAVCARLQEAGIPAGQIIIWDRLNADLRRGGFTVATDPSRVRCFGNDLGGYTSALYEMGSVCSRLARVVTESCTALINLPVLKDHGIVGLSASMKNYFGAIDNPNKYHTHTGDPFVADVSRLPQLREKTRLVICDALTAQYEGGPPYMPQWCWPLEQLFLATDPVALDSTAWRLIDDKRRLMGMPSLQEAGREPVYILRAARAGLGVADPARIEVIEMA